MEIGAHKSDNLSQVLLPATLPENLLPTIRDVLSYFLYLKNKDSAKDDHDIRNLVAQKLENIWRPLCIPTILTKSIVNKMKSYYDTYNEISIHERKRKSSDSVKKKINEFLQLSSKLFDIARCRCGNDVNCLCDESAQILYEMRDFLEDQRSTRQKTILQAMRLMKTLEHSSKENPCVSLSQVLNSPSDLRSQPNSDAGSSFCFKSLSQVIFLNFCCDIFSTKMI